MIEITEAFLAKIAGWQAMKEARGLLAIGRVLSSNWTPPILKGVVQAGEGSLRSGLVIKSETNIENMCGCRTSREWGTICAHSIAVGLHHLGRGVAPAETGEPASPRAGGRAAAAPAVPSAPQPPPKEIRRAGVGEPGEPLELHLILPPNFDQSAGRGKIMLFVEGAWRAGRAPLNTLSRKVNYRLDDQDARLLDGLEALTAGQAPGMVMVGGPDFVRLLPLLVEHPRVTLGKSKLVRVESRPWSPPLKVTLLPGGELRVEAKGVQAGVVVIENAWVWCAGTLRPVALGKGMGDVLKGGVTVDRPRVPQFLSQDWPAMKAAGTVESNFSLADFHLDPQPPKFILNLGGGLAQLSGQLQCAYGRRILTLGVSSKDEALWIPDPGSPTRYSTRDLASERAAVDRLNRAGFVGPDSQGRFQLQGQDGVLTFFARDLPKLEKIWEVSLEERLERSTSQNLERVEPTFSITPSGVQWFDLEVSFGSEGGERFSAADVQRLVRSGQTHQRLRNGKIALIDVGLVDELNEVLRDCSPQQVGGAYRIGANQAGFLDASLKQNGWEARGPAAWRERAEKQSGAAVLECPPLGDLEGVLRPYQKQGVAWMVFLRENGFAGILADEMGLGKTLQALAYLNAGVGRRTANLPSLVVCPTSLVFNWASEAARFTPGLRVLVIDGAKRDALFARLGESDLVVTSYALLRRDAAQYRGTEFDTVILDEAQHIKNRQTQNAQAVKSIRGRHRLVLTGTPLENSVLDLWSIFDFLMPGYLGTAQDFRDRYEQPIARLGDKAVQARLARRVKPFVLRRLKTEVAADLPAKIEQVLWCDLTRDQAVVYRQLLDAGRKELVEAAGTKGSGASRMRVLTTLLRLRQACCDLRLLKLENIDPATASAKLELFGELLDEALDGGHRVLVFSQFVEMLQLVKTQLEAASIRYSYLDGSTSDRGAVVNQFQSDEAIPVFLISLKAGGVGLNLTGADTVIHLDPWWNPAVEDQATGRAHRIGQTRAVTSYKLVSKGTVEEKIVALQAKKREMFQGTLGDEEAFANSLSWDEIEELLVGQ